MTILNGHSQLLAISIKEIFCRQETIVYYYMRSMHYLFMSAVIKTGKTLAILNALQAVEWVSSFKIAQVFTTKTIIL